MIIISFVCSSILLCRHRRSHRLVAAAAAAETDKAMFI
jgi:hypothetical protein